MTAILLLYKHFSGYPDELEGPCCRHWQCCTPKLARNSAIGQYVDQKWWKSTKSLKKYFILLEAIPVRSRRPRNHKNVTHTLMINKQVQGHFNILSYLYFK